MVPEWTLVILRAVTKSVPFHTLETQKRIGILKKRLARCEYIMRKKNRTGKRLRLTPLILGGYAAFLGFGLVVIGLSEMKEVIGIVRP